MEQCTCKCKTCGEEKVEEGEKKEEKPKFEPHNIHSGIRRNMHIFKGQEKDDVIKLLQKADRQEKERLKSYTYMDNKVEQGTKLTYEEEDISKTSWGMPQFKRDTAPVAHFDCGVNDDLGDEGEWEKDELFTLQKLAGLNNIDVATHKTSISIKEQVVSVLGKKYNQIRFSWNNDPESYLEQFLMINDAKTKISVSPLVEIFDTASKISGENDAMNTTCQVVVSKISSLFE